MAKFVKTYIKFIGLPEPEKKDFWTLFRDSQIQHPEYPKAKTLQKSTGKSTKSTRSHGALSSSWKSTIREVKLN